MIQKIYWCPEMNTQIKEYVWKCETYQLVKSYHKQEEGGKMERLPKEPLKVVGLDTIDLKSLSGQIYKYIQVFVDHFIRKVWIEPI